MNPEIIKIMGFEKHIEDFNNGICPLCKKEINYKNNQDEFRDELSIKEYETSGLCQNCQDKVFGK